MCNFEQLHRALFKSGKLAPSHPRDDKHQWTQMPGASMQLAQAACTYVLSHHIRRHVSPAESGDEKIALGA
jgi:hypothetical protein